MNPRDELIELYDRISELQCRLKRAILYLRTEAMSSRKDILNKVADELEAIPEAKGRNS